MGIVWEDKDKKIPNRHTYIPEFNKDGSEKHIVCDGARYHVLSYTAQGTRCSVSNCEVNKRGN